MDWETPDRLLIDQFVHLGDLVLVRRDRPILTLQLPRDRSACLYYFGRFLRGFLGRLRLLSLPLLRLGNGLDLGPDVIWGRCSTAGVHFPSKESPSPFGVFSCKSHPVGPVKHELSGGIPFYRASRRADHSEQTFSRNRDELARCGDVNPDLRNLTPTSFQPVPYITI